MIYFKKSYLIFSVDKLIAENLAQDMADLMHDFDVVSRYDSAEFYVHVVFR